MASVDPTTKTTYATTDWAHYSQGRPPYPQSLTELIYAYRRQHPQAQWERLVDVGAGSGIAATNFLAEFQIIHNSDPSPSNEAQARAFLPDWAQQHGLSRTFEYSQATGEEAYQKTGEGQADLAICATAAHFMDPDGLVTSMGKIYWMPTFPDQSSHFHEVFARTFDRVILQRLPHRAGLAQIVSRRLAGEGVLDSLPVLDEYFEDPVRVYINPTSDGQLPYKVLFQRYGPDELPSDGGSRVRAGEQMVQLHTGVDPEADGWVFTVDHKWLLTFLNTFRPPEAKLTLENCREELAEWDRSLEEECPSGQLRVQWPVYLVLGTRRSGSSQN
ncbi:hypothetical protein BO94DRAFT_569220 [Aspergillus sclerotioniger CBS 115572]|uniref:Methyltransferase type 11 domain-containing protein n=1 Tax=Aspergillus sclerotioniger CBS 115572 TaxID=1450535 RepID=A0A317VIV5_9EURO|nr:hypothetical protein BO94DRAFT_569220 [Aspergillus sclerotioniger CBS 115572]PWY71770.1 hypothetical protein BO94DRAFT_569220 [Aspergillus sclerotioniger CBS 115572]